MEEEDNVEFGVMKECETKIEEKVIRESTNNTDEIELRGTLEKRL